MACRCDGCARFGFFYLEPQLSTRSVATPIDSHLDPEEPHCPVATTTVLVSASNFCDRAKSPAKSGSCGDSVSGDYVSGELAAKATGSHKSVFYANDFLYLTESSHRDWALGDNLKRIDVGNG